MKPEELFIGAIVSFENRLCTVEHIERGIVCIKDIRTKTSHWLTMTTDDIQPVPITPEILKKLGWVIDKENEVVSRFVWAQKPPQGKLEFTTVEISLYDEELIGVKCLVEIRCSSLSNGINSLHSCDCENIHQLQAALRLCGIEKEIVL